MNQNNISEKQKPKKHHFVPQCYLRQFVEQDKLYVLDISKVKRNIKKEIKLVTPAQICYLPNYYTIRHDSVVNTFRLDQFSDMYIELDLFSLVEGKYAKIVSSLIEKCELPVADLILLSDFIIQLKLRNPYWEEKVIENKKEEWLNAAMIDITSKSNQDPRFSKIPNEVKEKILANTRKSNLDNPNYAREVQQFSLIQRFSPKNPSNTKIREKLLNCGWQLFKAPVEGPYFITSDNPGVAIGKEGTVHNSKFQDGFFYFLPLSPAYCLVITDNNMDNTADNKEEFKQLYCNPINSDIVLHINDKIIQVANNLLIASDTWYLSQIAEINKPKEKYSR